MKKFSKMFLGIFVLFAVLIFSFFAINATDEELSINSQALLRDFPLQSGFPLNKLKDNKTDKVPTIHFESYLEYKKDPASFDKLLSEHMKSLEPLLEAFNMGTVEVLQGDPWTSPSGIYPYNYHRLFLVMLSQMAHQGKTGETLHLLEKSNIFLVNIMETPKSIINKMISLQTLKRNLVFIESLKSEGLLKNTPDSLKASFQFKQNSEEIYKSSLKYEFASAWNAIKIFKIEGFGIGNFEEVPTQMDPFFKFLGRNSLRSNQTLNWLADIHDDQMKPGCLAPIEPQTIEDCSTTYNNVIRDARLSYYLINPVGRGLIRILTPKYAYQVKKMETEIAELNAKAAAL
jgi:hypothetical protein